MDEVLKTPVSTIAQTGLLGCLLIVAGVGIVVLFRQMNAQAKTNATDLKDVVQRVSDIATNIGVVLANWISSNEARTRAFELSVQNQQLTIAAQNALLEKVKDLREDVGILRTDIGDLKAENRQLREAILQRGVKL